MRAELGRHQHLHNEIDRLPLPGELTNQLDHLFESIPRQGVQLLTDRLLMLISKVKPLRFLTTTAGLLKGRLRYTT